LAEKQEKAFVEVIQGNQGLIHKVCFLYADHPDERKDLFQEIVLQLWRSFSTFRGDAKISTWIYRIALNIAISGWRKRSRRLQPEALREHHYNVGEITDEKEEQMRFLHQAIGQLSSIERALVMLYFEEMPYEDIATTLGITQNNVRVRMNRVKEKLRKIMKHGD
jgi:RNA polymerase sigma-70 factor, ECF subfamily